MVDLVYMRLRGRTASFRIPTLLSGSQLSLEMPGYATVLGILSYALNSNYYPEGQGIGFRYTYSTSVLDLETSHRWERDPNTGKLSYHETNPRIRQVHYNPILEIFLTDTKLFTDLKRPKNVLYLGRSQDLVRIEELKLITAEKVMSGMIGGTLLPINIKNTMNEITGKTVAEKTVFASSGLNSGMIYILPDSFDVDVLGAIRIPQKLQPYIALPKSLQQVSNINGLYEIRKQDLNPNRDNPWNKDPQTIYIYSYE